MNQPRKTIDDVRAIVASISFMDRKLHVDTMGRGFFLQVQYLEPDIETGRIEIQKARKWYVSAFSTESEIVETAFKACRISMEHVVKEHFTYRGRRVFSPHFHVQARIDACDAERFDARIPPICEEP